ncbi:MAG: SDR family NAD(P)-dependent oxidoreductase [Polaromonas sp.]
METHSNQIFREDILRDRTAVISGGGTGIGFAIARQLGQLGARVAICAKDMNELQAAAEKLRTEGIDAKHFFVNIRDEDAVAVMFSQLAAAGWQPDILVNSSPPRPWRSVRTVSVR